MEKVSTPTTVYEKSEPKNVKRTKSRWESSTTFSAFEEVENNDVPIFVSKDFPLLGNQKPSTCENKEVQIKESTCGCLNADCSHGFKKVPKKGKRRWVKFNQEPEVFYINAVGDEQQTTQLKLKFQVADVKKPLTAVKRICEKGNVVCFGPEESDNYIKHKTTGNKIPLRRNGKGSYLMDVCFVGGSRTQIIVDSGAEENVCPYNWGLQFGLSPADNWMNFRSASGSIIAHHGKRDVRVQASTF